MSNIKKAQTGIKIDKTSVSKPNAFKILKNDNQKTVTNKKKLADYHNDHARKSGAAARSYLMDDGNKTMYDFARKSASKSDSLAKDATKQARSAKAKPKFAIKKNGGPVKKKK